MLEKPDPAEEEAYHRRHRTPREHDLNQYDIVYDQDTIPPINGSFSVPEINIPQRKKPDVGENAPGATRLLPNYIVSSNVLKAIE